MEDKTPQNPTVLILLGAGVLTIIIILVIIIIRMRRLQDRNNGMYLVKSCYYELISFGYARCVYLCR